MNTFSSLVRLSQGKLPAALLFVCACLGSAAATLANAEPTPPEPLARITVDAAKSIGPVNPLVFGHNIEAADPYGIFSDKHRSSNSGQGFWDSQARTFVAPAIAAAEAVNIGALRYPGGSLANNYDWRNTVGPLAERPQFQFGVDEYIALCRRLRAEPIFTVSDYVLPADEMPVHAAALVEYLNAPAIPAHPWAMKRAAWGHPEPYGVKWFELGNETSFGNHHSKHKVIPFRRYTPAQYVDYARECAAAMRAIDPTIKIGVVTVPGGGRNIDLEWNRVLFRDAVPFADFVVLHFYTPGIANDTPDIHAALHACLAVGDQLGYRLAQYRAAIRAASGRDLPLALTEYNVGAIQDSPFPFRFSFAAGLFSTDFLRLCLQPENGVIMANYWQLIGGYWGAIRRTANTWSERATYPLFRLLGQHTATTLIATDVQTPRGTFPGFSGVNATIGDRHIPPRPLQKLTLPEPLFTQLTKPGKVQITSTGNDTLTVRLNGQDTASYPVLFKIDAPPLPADAHVNSVTYRVSFEGRTHLDDPADAATGFGTIGLGMVDARGWGKTASAVAITGVENASEWTPFTEDFNALPDAKAVNVLVRLEIKKAIHARMEIRALRIEAILPETFPAYPLLTTLATRSDDGHTLHLVVLNKSLDQNISTEINVRNFKPDTIELSELVSPPESITGTVESRKTLPPANVLRHTFPACSMTAITLKTVN